MSALGAIVAAMVAVPQAVILPPVTNSTGGTSVGDAGAGVSVAGGQAVQVVVPATVGERVAAGFLTVAVVGGVLGGGVFMVLES